MSEIFDRASTSYVRHHLGNPVQDRLRSVLIEQITKRVPRHARILDVGCGPGTHALPLARRGYRVVAIDVANEMLAELDRRAHLEQLSIELALQDVHRGLELAPADAAISIHGPISYTADPRPAMNAIASCLLPKAPIWIALPRAAALEQILQHPRRALAPLFARRSPVRVEGQLAGGTIAVHLWDPFAFARVASDTFDIEDVFSIRTLLHGPAKIDGALGRLPILRRFGASSVIVGTKR